MTDTKMLFLRGSFFSAVQIRLALLVGLAFSLTLPRNLSTVLVLALAMSAFSIRPFRIRFRFFAPYLAFFLLSALSIFWSEDGEAGRFLLIKQLLIPVLPFIFSFLPHPGARNLRVIRLSFAFSVLLITFTGFILAWMRFQEQSEYSLLFYHELAGTVGFSALYLSMYLVLGIVIWINELFETGPGRAFPAWLVLFFLIFSALAVLALASRASVLGLFLVLGIAVFWFRKEAWGVRLRWLLIGLVLVGTGVTLSVPLLRERFQEAINHNNQYGLEQVGGGTSFRLAKWEAVQRLWEKMPPQGFGIGDVQGQLNAQYETDRHPQLRNYNAHNQYFQTALGLGVPGLILLLLLLFYPLFPRPAGFFSLCFCFLFALCIFTESMLEVQKGVLFFSFFSGLTLLGKKQAPDQA